MIRDYYHQLTSFFPYKYQIEVANLLLGGKNVILTVPTGAGKTWASIVPFLYALEHPEITFPKKMVYSLPLRTLTNSIYTDIIDNKCIQERFPRITRQTGEFSDDKYFEQDIIFSTIDQTLSNFLCFPLALSPRQANINAGALVGSYLVFDEFHLLDANLSMATTLGMLKMLGNLCRCCIMTATLSKEFTEAVREVLPNFSIVSLDDNKYQADKEKIGSLLPKVDKKKLKVENEPLSAIRIAEMHSSKTIVICNRVETAQIIYNDLIDIYDTKQHPNLSQIKRENIICLHARFFDKDRKEKESLLKQLFGKKTNENEEAILIATQVIEAGMDISCDVMHTEISPANSFLQRAGRCARFENQKGYIYVYDVLDEMDKVALENAKSNDDRNEIRRINNKYLPYKEPLCRATLVELRKYESLDGGTPKDIIEKVLGEEEKTVINQLQLGYYNFKEIKESWNECQKNHYRSTIRDIQSVDITIIDDGMGADVIKYPYALQSLSMYKWSLVGWLNKIVKGEGPEPFDEEDWLVKELYEPDDLFLENDEEIKIRLKEITDFKSLPARVYVNAKYLGYDESFGFNWQYEETFNVVSPRKESKEKEDNISALKKDTFYQHNKALLGAFAQEFLGEDESKLDFAFTQIAKYIGNTVLKRLDFIKIIKLMIVLHDYGKLNNDWQKPMQHYQALKEGVNPKDFLEILGHTDYDYKDEYDIQLSKKANLNSRPAHAGVGAYVAQEVLSDMYEDDYITSSISMAIARHHSPKTSDYPSFDITDQNYSAMQKLLDEIALNVELEKKETQGNLEGFVFDDWEREQLVYLFFARILRICDQRATEDFEKYLIEENNV
uniref:CRISPR-associated helicase Cas3 n=1 Tax=Roseihalotalea indica TaxID=2867963 RepID=A0AA49GLJ0_9BACT|nr:CRISPR-associated helicase Cas3' [Tunicatimonas sp. TK19036]